jgi:hypothetical protein
MADGLNWRLTCNEGDGDQVVVQDTEPTACPINGAHTNITVHSAVLVKNGGADQWSTQPFVLLRVPTGECYKVESDAAGVLSTTKLWPEA